MMETASFKYLLAQIINKKGQSDEVWNNFFLFIKGSAHYSIIKSIDGVCWVG